MSFTRKFQWNGVDKPYPTQFSFNKYKLTTEDSGESPLTGIMVQNIIGKKRKLEMTWDRLTEEECHQIALIFEDKEGMVKFADASVVGDTEWKAYSGDFKAEKLYCNESDEYRYSVSLNLIQVTCDK